QLVSLGGHESCQRMPVLFLRGRRRENATQDCARGWARELLEEDCPRQHAEGPFTWLKRERADLLDDAREDWVRASQMFDRLAWVIGQHGYCHSNVMLISGISSYTDHT